MNKKTLFPSKKNIQICKKTSVPRNNGRIQGRIVDTTSYPLIPSPTLPLTHEVTSETALKGKLA